MVKVHTKFDMVSVQKDAPWQMSLVLDRVAIPEKFKPQSIVQKVDTRHIPEKVPDHPDLMIPLWRRVIAIIKERQVARLPFDTLAARSGCSEDDVKTWCENVELLIAMKTKRGYPRHLNGNTSRANPDFQFPKLLRDNESREIAECILATFEKSRGRKKQGIIQGVRDFIASFSVGEGGVSCSTHQKIKKQIHFLTSLNIPPQQIHVVRVEPKTAKLSPSTVQIKLALRFDLPESSVTVRSLYVHEYSRTGYNLVQVKNAHAYKKSKPKGNYGLRFAMYMIAIMAGLE